MMDDHSSKFEPGVESLSSAPAPPERGEPESGEPDAIQLRESGQVDTAADAALGGAGNAVVEPASELALPCKVSERRPAPEKSSRVDFSGGLQSVMMTVIIALFIITFIAQAFQIPTESMENTLLIGDYLLVDKTEYGRPGAWSWLFPYRAIQRGDVIVFHYPVNPEMYFVKRAVAVPGDRVRLHGGQLYVNGVQQQESFAIHRMPLPDSYRDDFPNGQRFNTNINPFWWRHLQSYVDQGELVVPPGCYFALGDNRDESLDSRYWGFVPRENVVGRPLIIYFSHAVSQQPPPSQEAGIGGKLASLAYTMEHLARSMRWSRALRVIH